MSKCNCKYAKWFPHNWLCLRGLYILSLVLFYLTLAFMIYLIIAICTHPAITGADLRDALFYYISRCLIIAGVLLTVAKVLKTLRAIKQAVAPCTCTTDATPVAEETK